IFNTGSLPYKDGFIPEPTNYIKRESWIFTNAEAKQANMVLSLYDDRVPTDQTKLIAHLQRQVEVYRIAYIALNPTDSQLANHRSVATRLSQAGVLMNATDLSRGFERFLTNSFKDSTWIVIPTNPVAEAMAQSFPQFEEKNKEQQLPILTNFATVARFRWLENSNFSTRLVEAAFLGAKSDSNEVMYVANHVTSTALA